MTKRVLDGGCLCGAVRYRLTDPFPAVIACHCRECRRMSGHFFAATAAPREGFRITNSDGLAWHESSARSRRGFCRRCGSSLFFDHGPEEPMGVAAGSLDADPGLALAAHIYVDEAGDYYALPDDDVPKYTALEWRRGGWRALRGQ